MIYNKYTKELYKDIAEAEEIIGREKEYILYLLKSGTLLHFKKDRLSYYIRKGKVEISSDMEKLFLIPQYKIRAE